MRGQISLGVILGSFLLLSLLLPYTKLEMLLLDSAREDVGAIVCKVYAHHYALLLSEAQAVGGNVNISVPAWVLVKVEKGRVDVNVDTMDRVVSCSEAIP